MVHFSHIFERDRFITLKSPHTMLVFIDMVDIAKIDDSQYIIAFYDLFICIIL